MKHPDRTEVRQVAFFSGGYRKPETFTQAMKCKIDSLVGKAVYNLRIATVEPVFGHLRNIGLDRFTLRGKKKVDAQWKLYCIVQYAEDPPLRGGVWVKAGMCCKNPPLSRTHNNKTQSLTEQSTDDAQVHSR